MRTRLLGRNRLPDAGSAYGRRWIMLVVICLGLMVLVVDTTIVNVALPTLGRQLHASTSGLQWIVDMYILVYAGLLLTAGSLGDRFGRYKAFTFGLTVFGLGSLGAALSGSVDSLIVTRATMGVGAAFVMPTTLSIITNVFTDPLERARAIGIWAGVAGLGAAIGPLAGGFLLSHFYWGSVFFVNLPIVAVVIVGAYWLVPESRHPLAPRQDPVGALLSMAGLGIVLWGVIEAPSHGWGSTPILVALTVGVATLAGFVAWELNCSSPMLDIGFFKNPRFTAASASITVMFFTLFGSLFVLTQYLQSVLGFGTLKAGAAVVPMAAAMMVVSPLSGGFVHRLGNKIVVTFGVLVVAVAMALLTRLGVHPPMWQPMGVAAMIGLGMGAAFGPATASLMGSVPRERAGVGSAMNDTTRQVGGAVGVAVFGSVLASKYHATVVRAAGVQTFPASVAGGIRNDVGSAVRFAHSGHAGVFAAAAASVARQGFVSALHAVALVGVVVMLLGAAAVAAWLPSRSGDEPATPATPATPVETGAVAADAVVLTGRLHDFA